MRYQLVYDLSQEGCRGTWFGVLSGVALTLAILCGANWRRMGRMPLGGGQSSMPSGLFWLIWLALAGTVFGFLFLTSYADYRELRAAMRDGQARVVDGQVENLAEDGFANHRRVHFVVGDTHFEYSESSIDANGYHQLLSRGSPLREGRRVRIQCVGQQIVRLELVDS